MGPERLKNATVSLKPRGAALVAAMNVGLIRRGLRGGVRKKDIVKFNRFWDEIEDGHEQVYRLRKERNNGSAGAEPEKRDIRGI